MDVNFEGDEQKQAEAKVKKVKILPLVIYTHIKDHVKTLQGMQKELKEKLTVVCKKDRMIIYTKSEHDYTVMRKKLEAAQMSFHTYSMGSEKPVVSILKGLPSNISTLEIKEELVNDCKLNDLEVKQFIKKQEINGKKSEFKLPIFSVKFEKNTKVADIKKVRNLCCSKITWEKNFSSSLVTQCYKCQAFGHIAKNCFRKEVCANCAGDHSTLSCEVNTNAKKCINCGGDHKANDIECDFYLRAINKRKNSKVNRGFKSLNNNNESPSRVNSTFAEATRKGQKADPPYVGSSNNDSNKHQQHQTEDEFSFGAFFSEIKSMFKNFDRKKLIVTAKNVLGRLKKCDDL